MDEESINADGFKMRNEGSQIESRLAELILNSLGSKVAIHP